jgi:DNA-binding Xre family transcriptional regulator
MNNQEILQKIVAYIEAIMVDKSMTSRDLAEICAKRSGKMSPRTIDKMFKTPSSTTLSTLLKVCDGLDLNLNAVFHSIEIAKTSAENGQQRLVYEIDNPAYNGYTGNYHVFYLPTSAYPEDHADQTLVHGVLKLGDFNSMHECSAILDIDSGDLTTEGSPFSKHYEGTLIYSSNSQMFCRLVCSKYGDMWFMVFNHGNLNNKELACVVGCAATASSGRIRHPAIHRFCLCNMQQYPVIDPDTQSLIDGLLRIQEKHIIIKKETVDTLLKQEDFDPAFRTNLENYLNIAQVYYALPKGTLKEDIPLSISIKELAKLSNVSSLEKTYHILHEDDRELSCILKNCLTAPTAPKDASESE